MERCCVHELSLKSISSASMGSKDRAVIPEDIPYVHSCLYHPDPHSPSWDRSPPLPKGLCRHNPRETTVQPGSGAADGARQRHAPQRPEILPG